jgi:hypothetical protein
MATVALAATLLAPLAPPPALAAAGGPGLVVVTPQTGDVVGTAMTVRVQMLGDAGGEARFYLAVDGFVVNGDRITGSRDPSAATARTVTPSSEAVLVVRDVSIGDHRLRAVPLTPGLQAPQAVTVSVRTGTGVGLPGVVVGILLVGLLLLYRRRILQPRMQRLQRRIQPPDGEPPDGEGEAGPERREGWD